MDIPKHFVEQKEHPLSVESGQLLYGYCSYTILFPSLVLEGNGG